jgi:hypothetical protein
MSRWVRLDRDSYVYMSRAEACDAMLREIKARFEKLPDLANAIQADHVKVAQEIEATLETLGSAVVTLCRMVKAMPEPPED